MKKVTTMAIIGGKEKQIFVYIEEELADWLDTIDEETRRDFILEEWKTERKNRAETRRHNSLERLLDAGWDTKDDAVEIGAGLEQETIHKMLKQLVNALPTNEREMMRLYFAKNLSYCAIGRVLGVSDNTVRTKILQNLKNFKLFLKNASN